MKKLALIAALLLPALAHGGDFVTNPASTLPGPKLNSKPVPAGTDPAKILQATDYNALREALFDVRSFIYAPAFTSGVTAPSVTATGTVTANAFAGSVSSSTVTATGATTARTAAERAADEVWVMDHGAKCDGVTDDRAAFVASITAAMATGKTVRLPAGTCVVGGPRITLANDGATPPTQKPLKIVGSGAHFSGRGTAPQGGSILDMRATDAYGKIVTTGLGTLEITGVTFTDSSAGTTPWLYTTNTTLLVHHNAFIGAASKEHTTCDQDAIILGGTTEVQGFGGIDDGFQGYGTEIRANYFNRIRRAVYGRTFANAVVVDYNTIWFQSGSNLAGGAAIEWDNPATPVTEYNAGPIISHNLIEMGGYPYGIKVGWTSSAHITGNTFWDPGVGSLAAVHLRSTAIYAMVIDGERTPSLAPLVDENGSTLHISSDATIGSRFNSTLSFGVASGGEAIGMNDGVRLRLGPGTAYLTGNAGSIVAAGPVYGQMGFYGDVVGANAAGPVALRGFGADGATAVAVAFENVPALANATAKIASFRAGTGSATEKASVNAAGDLTLAGNVFATGGYLIANGHRITWMTAQPASGTWMQGDVVWNAAVVAGGAPGWVCTAGGTPGTWKAMANLAP